MRTIEIDPFLEPVCPGVPYINLTLLNADFSLSYMHIFSSKEAATWSGKYNSSHLQHDRNAVATSQDQWQRATSPHVIVSPPRILIESHTCPYQIPVTSYPHNYIPTSIFLAGSETGRLCYQQGVEDMRNTFVASAC